MKKLVVLLAIAAVAVSAIAQNPVGAWKGKIQMDASSMPKAQNAQQQQMIDKMLAQMKSITLGLNVKANKTFTIDVPSVGGQPGMKGEGTWSQKGNSVTLVTTKQNGKPPKNSKPQTLKLESAKKMVLTNMEGPQKVSIIFTR